MSKYKDKIKGMTWSYSRVTTFESCPYSFFLRYIERIKQKNLFFSDFGGFVHRLLEGYLSGEIPKAKLRSRYLSGFSKEVKGRAPNPKLFSTYFKDGKAYFQDFNFPFEPIAVEKKFEFELGGNKFVGIIDCVARDGDDLIIVDHKSRALKPRSGRKKPTKSDEELDKYLRQLYIYSTPFKEEYGKFPDKLAFNCFRTGQIIVEPFKKEAYDKAVKWVCDEIDRIANNETWNPDISYWKCHHLCGVQDQCEYFEK